MRLLVVEDDTRLADLLARSLREEGYAVDVARDGDAAVTQAACNEYDGIVLDVQLPRRDGFAVSREIRDRGNPVPILMLTARDAVADRVAGLDAGADDYLTKPFDLTELHARVRALLRRMPAMAPARLTVGDLVIDVAAQTVTRGGEAIVLTTKEFVLLEYLARHAGRVIGRAELVSHVWDENHDPLTNAVEVYVNRLRKKIDAGRTPLLHTRRGSGYVLALRGDGDAAAGAD
jgi:two-component system copper resistance phosphate regulon response regulator CusR